MPTEWALLQQSRLRALSGMHLAEWRGIEMAFETADEETNPVWQHPTVNAMQCLTVHARIGGLWRRFGTWNSDDPAGDCGLLIDKAPTLLGETSPDTSIYRKPNLATLPCGIIAIVKLTTDEYGMVGSVDLMINGDCVSLYAAEVLDSGDGGFRIVEYDQSVLVRVNHASPSDG